MDDAFHNQPPSIDDPLDERAIFNHLLRPEDSYDSEGTYWADMPLSKRVNFITSYDAKEAKKELGEQWEMFKSNPFSPFMSYFRNYIVPGAGLGLEGYVLFSIGNLKPLFAAAWPQCWGSHPTVCNEQWLASVEYLEVVGIIVGQVLVGVIGDWLGRRWGLVQDATIMFLGLIMLTASWGVTLQGWVICYAWCLFFYGVGVGGEYPMTATMGMETANGSGKVSTQEDRLHRGRKVTGAFLMQGWGQFLNQVSLIVLLYIFSGHSGNPPYSEKAAQGIFRLSFALPAIGTGWLVYHRFFRMKYVSKQLAAEKQKSNVTGYDTKSLGLAFKHFGPRLFATAGSWFMNDIFFYGNKLFQNQFIAVISPNNKSLLEGWKYSLINIGVSMAGYYLASFLIDNKLYGRRNMQMVGFMFDFILFIIPGFMYNYYTELNHIGSFQAMYFMSSFFNQFGPNSVSFLVAAEVYPTPIRATAHGFSAAVGKLGALTAAVMYNYLDTSQKFHVVPWFGLAGALITWIFLPDTTGLDLKEQERRWVCLRDGREHDYHGVAVHPKHLSLWERWRGDGKYYDPEADYKQKIDEMRRDWEAREARKHEEEMGAEGSGDESEVWTDHISAFFQRAKTYNAASNTGSTEKIPNMPLDEKK